MYRTAPSVVLAGLVFSSALTLFAPAMPASAGVPVKITGRASVLPGAVEASTKGDSGRGTVSGTGRFIVFDSSARLVADDTDNIRDVYVKDLLTDSVERVNPVVSGTAGTGSSLSGAISPSGRYVAFWSHASNLVAGDLNAKADVFVRDRTAKTTERVSVSSSEVEGNGMSPTDHDFGIDISADGRYVTFSSVSSNLGADADGVSDIFLRDRAAGTTELISVNDAEASSDSGSFDPSMSADGRYVAFQSLATNLVPSDTNAVMDVFVRDRQGGTTQRVSVHDSEAQSPAASYQPMIDDSGANVAFTSAAKLNAIDPNSTNDVYLRNWPNATTTVRSVGTDGWAAGESEDPAISGDGATVAFMSTSPLALAGGNAYKHLYTRKITTTTRLTVSTAGQVATGTSSHPTLSADGSVAAFDSASATLVTGDTGFDDVFFRRAVSFGPFNDPSAFVQRQLADFTGGSTPGAVSQASAAIKAGASAEHYLVGLANAPSFAGKRPQLIRLYVAYFTRMPDSGGMTYWLNKLNGGTKLDAVSAQFAASNEFKTKYGSTTSTEFVTLVYNNVFDRSPDSAGLSYWVNKLNGGMSRGTVMTNFSESGEGKRHFNPWVQATLLGLGLLGKLPTGGLLTNVLDNATFDGPETAARIFIDSSEYSTHVL